MRTQSSFSSQAIQPKRRSWLQSLLLLGFIICLSIGLIALGALWWLYEAPSTQQSTLAYPTFQPERIIPQLALMHLAGDPSEALAYQALHAAELETSRALLWMGTEHSPAPSMALILKLAQQSAATDQTQAAKQLYQQASALAILDSALTPIERSQALLRCVTGLVDLGERTVALDAAQQLLLIVQQAPDLLPAQRSQLLRDLQNAAPSFPETDFSRKLVELIRNPYIAPSTTLLSGQWPVLTEEPTADPTVTAIIAERQQAARALAERLLQVRPVDAESERQRLVRALLIEDQQRTVYFYQISSAKNLTFSLQFWTLQQQRTWQLLKLAVAQRLYGLELIPEWEAEQAKFLRELETVNANLHEALLSLAQTEPTTDQQIAQRIYALTWLAQQVELGLYPQVNAPEIGDQLRVSQDELEQLGITIALPIAYVAEAAPSGFRIVAAISR
jgi:hypothetical protein